MKSLCSIFKFTIIVLSWFKINAQQPIYEHFNVDEGLPSSEVYDVYQGKDGYIWFATDKGLSRYNGYEFENFSKNHGLLGNTILRFYPQKNGQIWCYEFHSQSLFYFESTNFSGFTSYKFNSVLKRELNKDSSIKEVLLNSKDDLLISGNNINGIIKINNKGEVFRESPSIDDIRKAIKYQKKIFKTYLEYDNTLGLLKNINRINKKNQNSAIKMINSSNHSKSIVLKNKMFFLNKGVQILDHDSIKFIDTKTTSVGINKFDDEHIIVGQINNGAVVYNLEGFKKQQYLPNETVSGFLKDHEGGFWFTTTTSGVFYCKNPSINIVNKRNISSVTRTKNNDIIVGYHNGDIINETQHEYISKSLVDIPAKILTSNNKLYVYNNYELKNINDDILIYRNYLNSFSAQNNEVLLSFGNKLIYLKEEGFLKKRSSYLTSTPKYEKVKAVDFLNIIDSLIIKSPDFIQALANSNKKKLVGTSSGLYKLDNDSLVSLQYKSKLLNYRIDKITISPENKKVYLATQGAGVVHYGDSIYNINKKNGLTSDIVTQIYAENDSIIWAGTNKGLNKILFTNNNTYSIQQIDKSDGLISNEISAIEIVNDTVWLGTKQGLIKFPKKILEEKHKGNIKHLYLTKVETGKEDITKHDNVKLDYNDNSISFYLQALSYKNKISYKYRLKELDTVWQETKSRKITFPSLNNGNYTFEAKACIGNNCSDKIITYSFKINPPFWETYWFYSLCFLVFVGIIYSFFKIRLLTYNKDVTRELIRLIVKRLKRKEKLLNVRANGEDIKIPTYEICYIKSQGNYLDIVLKNKTITIRQKIGEFINITPDPLEYLRIHRSYIIRIDQVSRKGKSWVIINEEKIPASEAYLEQLNKIQF